MRYSENFQGLFSCQTQDRRVVISKCNAYISGFLLAQVNGKIRQALRAVVGSCHRNRRILAVRATQVAAVAAVRKDISSGAETHQRLLFNRIQG